IRAGNSLCVAAHPPDPAAVRRAVERGVAWLRRQQRPGGGCGTRKAGRTALALLALRHSGVPAADQACRAAATRLEGSLPDGTCYGAALGVLLLAPDETKPRRKGERRVRDLARGQCRNGQWTYSYRNTARKKAGDNSNTQLVILALAAARVHRFEVPAETFRRCGAFFRESQNTDGGFGYAARQRARSYGSMTAGGAMALVLCAAAERATSPGDPELRRLPEVKRALDWLGRGFHPARNRDAAKAFGTKKGRRGDSFWKHYWLWSLERAGNSAGARKVGGHDWYAEGARLLLSEQRDEGSWRDPEDELLATCFALLFFGHSTRAVLTPPERVTTPPAAG
ncbi:MAG: prenyltransferase/squalene oxidase repeat-containing protein, partial [Planctomycetota bacterium]